MVDRVKVGTFDADTGGGSQEVSWTSPDFTPTFLKLWTQGLTTITISGAQGVSYSEGWTDGTTSWAVAMSHEEGVEQTNCSRQASKTQLLTIVNDVGTVVGQCTLTSFTNKKFTINWNVTPTGAFKIHFMVLEPKNVDIVFQTAKTTTGAQTVTHAAFTANAIWAMGTDQTTLDTMEDNIQAFFGMSSGATEENVIATASEHDVANVNDGRGVTTTDCVRSVNFAGDTENYAADFTSFASGSFDINWSNASAAAYEIGYAVFEFDSVKVGTAQNPSSATTENTITGLGFTANGLHTNTVQTSSATTIDGVFQTGAVDSQSPEVNASAGYYTDDGSAVGSSGVFDSNVYAVRMVLFNTTSRADGIVTAFGVGTIEFTWTSVNGQRQFQYMAFDDTTGGPPTGRIVYQTPINTSAMI